MLDTLHTLRRLGAGDSIEDICAEGGIARDAFDAWWREETARRVPDMSRSRLLPVTDAVRIQRDPWGIPHIHAGNDDDLFVGFGYAMAQDRLFQLDYLRRKATGQLAAVLGPPGLETDTVARTVGLHRIAADEWSRMPASTVALVEAFSRGVNAFIDESRDCLPIEFDLLDYRPAPWSPSDCVAIAVEFRYYLTVRFPVIVIPELARRTLGDGPLLQAFMQGEADAESILHPGEYRSRADGEGVAGIAAGDPQEGLGSNNWVLAGSRTTSGLPLVASDPHIAFAAVSCWYEAHLHGGSFDVTGMAYAGMPAIMFGRNARVAWGITNNICSQRDLYLERTNPAHPGAFEHDGVWEPAGQLDETIEVRGTQAVLLTVRSSRNGPIVSDILPAAARTDEAVSLRWLGAQTCGWLTALLDMDRADSVDALRAALTPWQVPTFSLVFADVDGHIGYQAAGAIPLRRDAARGYRDGWDPAAGWQGLIPCGAMPRLADPTRGWIATANNRPAPDDFPVSLSGTWSSGLRARRIRTLIESRDRHSVEDVAAMQQDAKSLRAEACVPGLLRALDVTDDPRVQAAVDDLRAWDHVMDPDSRAAAIFEVFFAHWSSRVAAERFDAERAALLGPASAGLAVSLLDADAAGWFADSAREPAIVESMTAALAELTERLGEDPSAWCWGALHTIDLRHVLGDRGDLDTLLDRGGIPVRGNGVTVCNTGFDPNWGAPMGANYRLIADLSSTPPALLAVDAQGASGHPGSPHYGDQLAQWQAGQYHRLELGDAAADGAHSPTVLRLEPYTR